MRITFSLVIVLLLVSYIVAEENEDLVEVESTTKRPIRGKQKPLDLDCSETSDDNHIGYTCKSKSDDEMKPIGIRFLKTEGGFYCGQFDNDQPDGQGFSFQMKNGSPEEMHCGLTVEGKRNGLGQLFHFSKNTHSFVPYVDNEVERTAFTYWISSKDFARNWYQNRQCKSQIAYDTKGNEVSRNKYDCPAF